MDNLELIGCNLAEIFNEEIAYITDPMLRDAFDGFYSVREMKYNNNIYQVQTLPVRNENGEIYVVMQLLQNITERKQAEDALIKAFDKEKELNQLKSKFISIASHEFRTPLTGISLNTELLETLTNSGNAERDKLQKCFTRIYDAIHNLSLILDEVSLMAKDQSGRLEFDPALLNFETYCQQVVEEILTIENKSKIKFLINTNLNEVLMDKKLLRHIIINLLTNAIKYSEKDSFVIFEINELLNNHIQLVFIDSGIGIPKEDMQHIFEPFHRASNAANIKGTGLGMSIVKRCVDLYKGTIDIKSEVGKGTVVKVEIPYLHKGRK